MASERADKKIYELMRDQKYAYLGGFYLLNYYSEIICDLKLLEESFETYETGKSKTGLSNLGEELFETLRRLFSLRVAQELDLDRLHFNAADPAERRRNPANAAAPRNQPGPEIGL